MIWSIREARARVEGEGARGRRGWRRLGFLVALAWIEWLGFGGFVVVGGGERGPVSVSSVGSKVGCDGSASWASGICLADWVAALSVAAPDLKRISASFESMYADLRS